AFGGKIQPGCAVEEKACLSQGRYGAKKSDLIYFSARSASLREYYGRACEWAGLIGSVEVTFWCTDSGAMRQKEAGSKNNTGLPGFFLAQQLLNPLQ
ncbi:MAG: hypothetical protein RI563_00655, partial [Thiohalophilus sp.]|uniref:hypothetical protein n=1 Tax=Thiohalophilus sp. TaxID=3028392 RepID=UPI00286FB522